MGLLDGFRVTLRKMNHASDTGEIVTTAYPQHHPAEPGRELGGGHHSENPVTLHRASA